MSNFVLIPGAWMGAWVWEPVTRRLRELRHNVHPVTLSGLDNEHEGVSDIGLETHVEGVLTVLKERDLRSVIVVGHSYSGIVAGQVADRAPERVSHTVFVEAFVPHDGKSMLDSFPESQSKEELRQIAENEGRWPPPRITDLKHEQDLSTTQVRWLSERFVGHPERTVAEPAAMDLSLAAQRTTYIAGSSQYSDGAVAAMREEPNWTFRKLDAGHWPMVAAPSELAVLLAEAASGADAP